MTWLDALTNRPIEDVLYTLTVWFGWISTSATLVWGFIRVWQSHRQGDFAGTLKHVLLSISVPANTEQTPKAVESLFATLSGCFSNFNWKERWIIGKFQATFSFEIVSIEGYIQFLVHTQTKFRDLIEASIYAHYPEAEITEVEDYARVAPERFPDEQYDAWGAEVTSKEAEYLPIRTYVDFEDRVAGEYKDPLGQILEVLAKMRPGEQFWMQVLVQACGSDWKKSGLGFINKSWGVPEKHKKTALESAVESSLWLPNEVVKQLSGLSFLPEEAAGSEQDPWKAFKVTPIQKEQVDGVLRKIGKIGHATKIRLVYLARKEAYNKGARASILKGLLTLYAHQNMNSFGFYGPSVPKDDYFWQKWSYAAKQKKLVQAYASRSWGAGADPKVLSTEELATLWHFPAIGVKAPLVQKSEARRAEPPAGLPFDLEGVLPVEPVHTSSADHGGHSAVSDDGHVVIPAFAPSADSMSHGPDLIVPPLPTSSRVVDEPEEREMGLDATDIAGGPAGVELPGAPAMQMPDMSAQKRLADDADDETPPNLPV